VAEPQFHQLVPEDPRVVPTVGVDAVWSDLVAAIKASPAKDRLFWSYAEKEVAENEHTARLRVQETAVAVLNVCLRNRLFVPRINGGDRFYRVPNEAFVPPFWSAHGLPNADALTWSGGVLYRIDAAKAFQWIAAGRYALLLTEGEAAVIRDAARQMIAEEEREHRREAGERILDRARRGEISAREAEMEAKRQGLDELASRPSAEEFDPRKRPAWTLPMALAWIAWRSFDEVREWDSDYRGQCWVWTTSNSHPEGRRLKRREAATVWEFECMGYLRQAERESEATDREFDSDMAKRVKAELWAALREGAGITADGIPGGNVRRQPIPSIEWEDLESHERSGGRDALRFRLAPDPTAYSQVRIPQAQIITRWPERRADAARAAPFAEASSGGFGRPRLGRPSMQAMIISWLGENRREAASLTDKEIARKLGASPKTVQRAKAHLAQIGGTKGQN
jgi:hypothetical protein